MPPLSLDDVLKKVVEDAVAELRSKIREIEEEQMRRIEARSEELLARASTAKALIQREASAARSRIVTQTSLDARREYLSMVEEAVAGVISESLERISEMRGGERYSQFLERTMREAIEVVGGEEVVVECGRDDAEFVKELAGKISEERNISVKVSNGYLESRGGVRVMRADGSIVYDNTLEARLERMKTFLRSEIVKRLMG
jgi:V/A-type H+-transporting ATPase subunit E